MLARRGKGGKSADSTATAAQRFQPRPALWRTLTPWKATTEWMKGLFAPVPDDRYELRSFAVDEGRNNVTAYGVFRGTHTGNGGPVPPTGKQVEADYVYVMQFDGDRIPGSGAPVAKAASVFSNGAMD